MFPRVCFLLMFSFALWFVFVVCLFLMLCCFRGDASQLYTSMSLYEGFCSPSTRCIDDVHLERDKRKQTGLTAIEQGENATNIRAYSSIIGRCCLLVFVEVFFCLCSTHI